MLNLVVNGEKYYIGKLKISLFNGYCLLVSSEPVRTDGLVYQMMQNISLLYENTEALNGLAHF